ncbi:MAG: hypothetical protein RR646_06800 [Erysipelotrichaceae bacterium]
MMQTKQGFSDLFNELEEIGFSTTERSTFESCLNIVKEQLNNETIDTGQKFRELIEEVTKDES